MVIIITIIQFNSIQFFISPKHGDLENINTWNKTQIIIIIIRIIILITIIITIIIQKKTIIIKIIIIIIGKGRPKNKYSSLLIVNRLNFIVTVMVSYYCLTPTFPVTHTHTNARAHASYTHTLTHTHTHTGSYFFPNSRFNQHYSSSHYRY